MFTPSWKAVVSTCDGSRWLRRRSWTRFCSPPDQVDAAGVDHPAQRRGVGQQPVARCQGVDQQRGKELGAPFAARVECRPIDETCQLFPRDQIGLHQPFAEKVRLQGRVGEAPVFRVRLGLGRAYHHLPQLRRVRPQGPHHRRRRRHHGLQQTAGGGRQVPPAEPQQGIERQGTFGGIGQQLGELAGGPHGVVFDHSHRALAGAGELAGVAGGCARRSLDQWAGGIASGLVFHRLTPST